MTNNIMVFELDSINQASKFGIAGSKAAAIKEITGMIRSALVFSGELLVTDSMLLDGFYFQEIGPHGLASELGVSSPGMDGKNRKPIWKPNSQHCPRALAQIPIVATRTDQVLRAKNVRCPWRG